MNQNINNISPNNSNMKNASKFIDKRSKILILLIILIIILSLLLGSYLVFKNLNEKKSTNNDSSQNLEEVNQLWNDFNNGLITTDEYIRYNLYNIYDKSLLNERYENVPEIRIDDLVSKYYDELSKDTLNLYFNYYSLSNISFNLNNDTNSIKPLANTISNETTINLNSVYLSSNGNFLIWYTNEGKSAIQYSNVEKYAELLENIISQYDNIFNVKYYFKSKVISGGKRYKEQLKILNNNGIDEKYMTEAMHIYIYDLNSETNAGLYHSLDETNNGLIDFANKFLYSSDDDTIITPYISLNSSFINNTSSNFEDTIAHEMFHHYQNYVINGTVERNSVSDIIIGEATAQWAAAKIAKNDLKNNSLNIWVSNYIKHTGDIFTGMYNSVGTEVAYAMFKFLDSYEYNVSSGTDKILKSIHSEDGFKYLNDNSTNEERNRVMQNLALKNLNNDYPNYNYFPKNNDLLSVKKEVKEKNNYSEKINLSASGIDYYLFESNLKSNFKISLSAFDENTISLFVIAFNNGNYEVVSIKNNINSLTINSDDFENYEKLYIVIVNNDFKSAHNYQIKIEESTIKNNKTFNTSFNNYKIKGTSTIVMYGIETNNYINGVIDELHQKEHLDITTTVMGINVTTSTYVDFSNGYTYTKNPLTNVWEKTKDGTTFIDLTLILEKLRDNENVTKINSNHYLVKLTKDDIKGLLKYNNNLNEYNLDGDIFVNVYINDNYISKLEYDFSSLISEIAQFNMTIEFYDYNNAGDVSIPAEIN